MSEEEFCDAIQALLPRWKHIICACPRHNAWNDGCRIQVWGFFRTNPTDKKIGVTVKIEEPLSANYALSVAGTFVACAQSMCRKKWGDKVFVRRVGQIEWE